MDAPPTSAPHLTPVAGTPSAPITPAPAVEATSLRQLTPEQLKSGAAAWLGWLFDGLDMHLYIVVATPFVMELIGATTVQDSRIGLYSSWIQAAFLIGWAVGGAFFGLVSDRIGRSRALVLTILTYALFTGLSYFAQTWWHLLILRFVAALGIGGEWAVGSALLCETWPKKWRPWMAAVLQTAVNLGIMLAGLSLILLAKFPPRTVFLVGVLPAFLVLWIRRAVPEPEEWHRAVNVEKQAPTSFFDLFRGPVRKTTFLTLSVCTLCLTGHWAFIFWNAQHLRNMPELQAWTAAERNELVGTMLGVLMAASIAGNFLAAWLAYWLKNRRAIALMSFAYFLSMFIVYRQPLSYQQMTVAFIVLGLCSGLFALFTMYLPPLFPTLLRTTGAGFCYNFGRIVAGIGTVVLGRFTQVGDYRLALLYSGFLFLPAAIIAWNMPELPEEQERFARKPVSG